MWSPCDAIFEFGKNDNFLLFIDPFNNKTTGFTFPLVQMLQGPNGMGQCLQVPV